MARRRTTAAQRHALADDLRQACREGDLRPGAPLPTMRELQEKYRLSPSTVLTVLRELTAEGLLRTVPRVGVFVAEPEAREGTTFVMVTPPPGAPAATPAVERLRLGFEERVTEAGAASISLRGDVAEAHRRAGTLPPLAGVFVASRDPGPDPSGLVPDGAPQVWLSPHPVTVSGGAADTVHMDNVDGGRRATAHLARHGHRRIAYLGLHPRQGPPSFHTWSALREQGWREAMAELGEPVERMSFLPAAAPTGHDDEVAAATAAAQPILVRRDVSAVVCANDHAVLGLLAALRDADVPPSAWPSLVGFDGLAEVTSHVLTSMRLPWEAIGRQAAQLLCDRAAGRLTGPARHHELPMSLVARIGSRRDWPSAAVQDLPSAGA